MAEALIRIAPGTRWPVGVVFQFGDGASPLSSSVSAKLPLPFDMKPEIWWAVLDASGSVDFAIEYASSVTGVFSSIGGTQPSVVAAIGAQSAGTLNWATVDWKRGGVLRVVVTGISGPKGITLTIGTKRV